MYKFLFILIGAVLTSNEVKAECRMITLINLHDPNCYKELSIAAKDIMELDPYSEEEGIPDFHKCSLEKMNLLENGEFSSTNMKKLINNHVVSVSLRKKLYKRFEDSAKEAKETEDDKSSRARKFGQLLHEAEIREHLLIGYFCIDD